MVKSEGIRRATPSGAERASREGGVGAEVVIDRRSCDEIAQAASRKVDLLDSVPDDRTRFADSSRAQFDRKILRQEN